MKSIKPLILLSTVLSLGACSKLPTRPDAYICVNNVGAFHKKCYNLLKDYTDDGLLKPGAMPSMRPLNALADADKDISTDPDGWGRIKAYIRLLRSELSVCKSVPERGNVLSMPSPLPSFSPEDENRFMKIGDDE